MKTLIDFKDWIDYPRCTYDTDFGDVCVKHIEYKDKILNIGDKLTWLAYEGNEKVEITADQIRLNPTLRVWDNKTGMYYLVIHCIKEVEIFENYC